jgi:hypothetical protein
MTSRIKGKRQTRRQPSTSTSQTPGTIMGSLGRLTLGCTLLLLAASPAAAQQFHTAAGYGAGNISFGAFNPDAGAEAAELALQSGPVFNVFGEAYQGAGYLGLRGNVAFTQRPLEFAGESRKINTWLVDAGVVLRPLPLRETSVISPFLTAGGGVISYGLGRNGRTVVIGESDVLYPGDDERQWMLVGGGGLDIIAGRLRVAGTPLGLRLEAANHVTLRSPFRTLAGERPGPIHNLRIGASLVGFGSF